MRLILLFLVAPLGVFAQVDSLVYTYAENTRQLSTQQQQQFRDLIKNKQVDKVSILAIIGSQQSISKNRVTVEFRVNDVQRLCQSSGLYFNQIDIKRQVTTDTSLFNKVILRVRFIPDKEDSVIFKTETLEISKNQRLNTPRVKKKNKKPIVKKKAYQYRYLNSTEFKVGKKVVLNNVHFPGGRHLILAESFPTLDDLVQLLKERPTMIIELHGHICCLITGADGLDIDSHARNLSVMRAKAVYDFLVESGIDYNRLSYKGFGSRQKLIKDDGDEWSAKKNRRVEVYIVSE